MALCKIWVIAAMGVPAVSAENEKYGLWSVSTLHLSALTYVVIDAGLAWQRNEPAFITSTIYLLTFVHMVFCIMRGDFSGSRRATWVLLVFVFFIREMLAFAGYFIPLGQISSGLANIQMIGPYISKIADNMQSFGLNMADIGTLIFLFALSANIASYFRINKNGEGTLERIIAFCIVLVIGFFALGDLVNGSISSVSTDITASGENSILPAQPPEEWYFLPFYSVLRAVASPQGGAALLALALLVPALAVFIGRPRAKGRRLFFDLLAVLALLSFAVLGFLGTIPPEGKTILATQVLIAIYLSYFIFGTLLTPRPERY